MGDRVLAIPEVTLVLGGTRSGKSGFAQRLVEGLPGPWAYLATGSGTDSDMATRIAAHRDRRGAGWETIEAGAALAPALIHTPDQVALVDSLGTWVAAHHDFAVDVDALTKALAVRVAATVIVSDEVGLGVHPSTEVGRQFRDALGLVNQAVASVAGAVWLVVAGRGLRLESP